MIDWLGVLNSGASIKEASKYDNRIFGGKLLDWSDTAQEAVPATYRLNQIFVRDVLDNFIVSPDVSARPKLIIN